MTARREWLAEHLDVVLILAIVGVIAVITMAISYQHEYVLARRNGQVTWVAALVPFSVDGMLMVASIALYWAGRKGIRRPWRPACVAVVGIGATVAANMFSDLRFWWLGPAVAASSGVATVLIGWVAFWLTAEIRKLAAGDFSQLDVTCSCPPPPASLAEALPLARQVLREAGMNHGQAELAERFGVSVHQVRKLIAAPAGAALNGDGPHG